MQLFNGTRLGSFLQTLLYITGVPLQSDHSNNVNNKGQPLLSSGSNIIREYFEKQIPNFSSKVQSTNPIYDPINTKCYGVLGCIQIKYPKQRGFELFPQDLNIIKPKICLQIYNDRVCQHVELDETVISRLLLNKNNNNNNAVTPEGTTSYWIAHGYVDNGQRRWIQEMTDELLEYDNYANIFIIDWGKGAEPPYSQAATNIELIGAYIGFMMTIVEDLHGLKISQIHFIGHSLGAHMGGFIGSWLKLRGYSLGRITGLDPAQPYFELFPVDTRLDSSDANFVDVIHTDASPLLHGGSLTGLGTQEPCGHIDFYPNDGKDQPGCKDGVVQAIVQEKGSVMYGLRRFFACNHIRAYEYFTESIRSNCRYTSFMCESFNSFMNSECVPNCHHSNNSYECNQMGFHAKFPVNFNNNLTNHALLEDGNLNNNNIKLEQYWRNGAGEYISSKDSILYYSMTGNRVPYCREHYVVTLKFDSPILFNLMLSELKLFLIGSNGNIVQHFSLDGSNLIGGPLIQYTVPGNEFSLLQQTELQDLHSITIQPIISNPISWLAHAFGKSYKLSIESLQLKHLESGYFILFCSKVGNSIINLSVSNSKLQLTRLDCLDSTNRLTEIL